MPLTSTVIGSFHKPDYLAEVISDWFTVSQDTHEYILQYNEVSKKTNSEEIEKVFLKASSEILKLQEEIGIDVVTDGEMRRENYVYYFCRKLNGFDFEKLTKVSPRNGAYTAKVPTITGPVSSKEEDPWVWKEWLTSQEMSKKPVKITLPAPLTIINTVMNEYYKDNEKELCEILVKEINREVVALSKTGCKYIQVLHPFPDNTQGGNIEKCNLTIHLQIDEPVMVRYPEKALSYGIDNLAKCFVGVSDGTTKVVHLCCGYPLYLDQKDYQKADPSVYFQLAKKLDNAGFDEISIEDAHRHNDLSLFDLFKKSIIVLGVVQAASSRVESVEEIRGRVEEVLKHVPRERLIIAPDCGLGFLPDDIMKKKLQNMIQVCQSI